MPADAEPPSAIGCGSQAPGSPLDDTDEVMVPPAAATAPRAAAVAAGTSGVRTVSEAMTMTLGPVTTPGRAGRALPPVPEPCTASPGASAARSCATTPSATASGAPDAAPLEAAPVAAQPARASAASRLPAASAVRRCRSSGRAGGDRSALMVASELEGPASTAASASPAPAV